MGLAALIASCSDDDRNNDTDNQHLVSPSMAVSISNTAKARLPAFLQLCHAMQTVSYTMEIM